MRGVVLGVRSHADRNLPSNPQHSALSLGREHADADADAGLKGSRGTTL